MSPCQTSKNAYSRPWKRSHPDGLVAKLGRLPRPHPQAHLVNGIHQADDFPLVKAAAEIASRGGVRDAAGAKGIEEYFVVTAQLDVLQTSSFTQGVIRNVDNMVGLKIGQMDLKHVQMLVDRLSQAQLPNELGDDADAAVCHAMAAIGEFVMDVAGGEHGAFAVAKVILVQPTFDPLLAAGQLLPYGSAHSKSLRGPVYKSICTL